MRTSRDACMDSKVVRADFGSGLICHRAQKCCALKSSAPFGARQDNYADLLGLQTRRGSNHSTAHVGESNSRSNVFRSVAHQLASPAVGKFSRASSAGGRRLFAIKLRKSDRVGRRGLSEPREDFSRLTTYAIPWLYQYLYPWLESVCVPSCWKVLSASSAGGRRHLRLNFANQIVSVAEDCLSPERTFHGCTLMQFRGSNSWLYFCELRSIMIDDRNHPRLQNITMNPVVVNPISPNANAYPYFQCSSGIKSKFIP